MLFVRVVPAEVDFLVRRTHKLLVSCPGSVEVLEKRLIHLYIHVFEVVFDFDEGLFFGGYLFENNVTLLIFPKSLKLDNHALGTLAVRSDNDVELFDVFEFERGRVIPSFRQAYLIVEDGEGQEALFLFVVPVPVDDIVDFGNHIEVSVDLPETYRPFALVH